jgi:hypothetical protein
LKSPLPVFEEFQNPLLIGEILPPKSDSQNVNQGNDGNLDKTEQFQKKSKFKIELPDSSQPEDDPTQQDQDAPHEGRLLTEEVFSEDNEDNLIKPKAVLVTLGSGERLITSGEDIQESKNPTTLPKKTELPDPKLNINLGTSRKVFTLDL